MYRCETYIMYVQERKRLNVYEMKEHVFRINEMVGLLRFEVDGEVEEKGQSGEGWMG